MAFWKLFSFYGLDVLFMIFMKFLHSSHLNTITVMLILQMTTQEASRKSAGCFKTCVWYTFPSYDFIAANNHCDFQWEVNSCDKWYWTESQRTSTDRHSGTRFLRYNGKILSFCDSFWQLGKKRECLKYKLWYLRSKRKLDIFKILSSNYSSKCF